MNQNLEKTFDIQEEKEDLLNVELLKEAIAELENTEYAAWDSGCRLPSKQ